MKELEASGEGKRVNVLLNEEKDEKEKISKRERKSFHAWMSRRSRQ